MPISENEARLLGQALYDDVLNAQFGLRGKKETQIALISAMANAGIITIGNDPNHALATKLGMDPNRFENLLYSAFLADPDINSLTITHEELKQWNRTTERDAKNEEIRFEVPSLVAKAKLNEFFTEHGIQPEMGRNTRILIIRADVLAAVVGENAEIPQALIQELSETHANILAEMNQSPTTREKILVGLRSGLAFVISTVVAEYIRAALPGIN